MIATDNTTVVAYVSKRGGTHSHTRVAAGSGSASMATVSRYSRLVISAQPAHHNRVEPPPKAVNLAMLYHKTGRGSRCSCFYPFPCLAESFRSSGPLRRVR